MRVQTKASRHGFVIRDADKLYFSYLPMFNVANHQRQLILSGTLDESSAAELDLRLAEDSKSVFTFHTKPTAQGLQTVDELLKGETILGDIYKDLPDDYGYAYSSH